jgi:hypothetical protein
MPDDFHDLRQDGSTLRTLHMAHWPTCLARKSCRLILSHEVGCPAEITARSRNPVSAELARRFNPRLALALLLIEFLRSSIPLGAGLGLDPVMFVPPALLGTWLGRRASGRSHGRVPDRPSRAPRHQRSNCRAWECSIPLAGRFHFPLPRRGGPFVSPGFGTRLRTNIGAFGIAHAGKLSRSSTNRS